MGRALLDVWAASGTTACHPEENSPEVPATDNYAELENIHGQTARMFSEGLSLHGGRASIRPEVRVALQLDVWLALRLAKWQSKAYY